MSQGKYGVAYQEARSELLDITSRFEQLKLRKRRLEGLVEVIGPLLGMQVHKHEAPAAKEPVFEAAPSEPDPAAEPLNFTFDNVPVPLPSLEESGGDPFQRRVRGALKFRSVGEDRRGLQTAV